jgi:hypothetical protein
VLWLDWAQLPGLDTEARLSQLTRWVLEADRLGLGYGLNLSGNQFMKRLWAIFIANDQVKKLSA